MAVYKHSGALGHSLILAPLLGTAAALVLALVYAYIDVWSPIAGYISVLFVMGFAVGLAFSMRGVAKMTRCRNPGFMTLVGVWTGVVALYASWAFFIYALFSRYDDAFEASMLDVFLQPVVMWKTIQGINETGWYTIRGVTPSGVVLWGFWGIEAALILAGATIGGWAALLDDVFCERCRRWLETDAANPRLMPPSAGMDDLQADQVEALEALPTANEGADPHLMVELRHCHQCGSTSVGQLKKISFEANDKGQVSEKSENLGDQHVLSPEDYGRLAALSSRT